MDKTKEIPTSDYRENTEIQRIEADFVRHSIDSAFLSWYLLNDMIPKGLRIVQNTCFLNDTGFVKEWYKNLNNCSLNIMRMLLVRRHTLAYTLLL